MQRLLIACACLLLMTGLVCGVEVTLVKFDKEKKELAVKEGAEEKTYKVTEKTKFVAVDKKTGTSKELPYDKALKGLLNPNSEGKLKFDITVKDGAVVEAKLPGREKK
jgi:hypothetical protein